MNAHMDALPVDNIEAEQAVLGTILLHNTAFDAVSSILEPEHFNEHIHRLIFKAISDLLAKGKGANPVTIMNFLPADEQLTEDKNVRQYVAQLVGSMSFPVSMVRDMAVSVYEMWLRRTVITTCEEAMAQMREMEADEEIWDQIARIEEKIAEIRAKRIKEQDNRNAGLRYLESMEAAAKRDTIEGVPICLDEIRKVISEPCFEAGNLYGLLSSSGEGKTSLTIQIIHHALDQGHPVLFLSYDQSEVQISRQMCAQVHDITVGRQRDTSKLGNKEWEQIAEFGRWLGTRNYEVIKCSTEKAAALKGYARQFLRRRSNGKTPLVVVDHIGMVTPENDRMDEGRKANGILQVFKNAAAETNSAWLVLNQRNTYGMRRDNPRPIGQDLYGGEGAKQPYDAVIYLYRFKKYFEDRKDIATTDADWKKIHKAFPPAVISGDEDIAEIGAIKVRFGSPSVKKTLKFEGRITLYTSLKQQEQPELLP